MTRDEQMAAVHGFVLRNPLATIATINQEGDAELAGVYLCPDQDDVYYFVTRSSSRKFMNIMRTHQATVLCMGEEELTMVEMDGRVDAVTDTEVSARAVAAFQKISAARKKEYWVPPVSQLPGDHFIVMRFVPGRITYTHFPERGDDAVYSFTLA